MDNTKHTKRLLLASIIIFTTLYISVQNHRTTSGSEPTAQATAVQTSQNDRNTPSTSFVWILGSSLLGLVGLKRFGLNRG